MKNKLSKTALSLLFCLSFANFAHGETGKKQTIKDQMQDLQQQLQDLQTKINTIEEKDKIDQAEKNTKKVENADPFKFGNNSFNPQIGLVLNGSFTNGNKSNNNYNRISGFDLGENSSNLENKGFSLGESELSLSSNVDDMFKASATFSVEDNAIEAEEAYIQTLSMPYSLSLKAGRFFADIGYLNSFHSHHDNFTQRPLPYQVFLDGQYNDDGAQISYLLPTPFYAEAVAGVFAGNKFPAGGRENNNGAGAYSLSLKTGGDLGKSSAFLTGISYLGTKAGSDGRQSSDGHNFLNFQGQNNLYIAHLKYNWSPNGNNLQKELILQGEYFIRNQKGSYAKLDETGNQQARSNFRGNQNGFYAEAVYKFLPKWRIGYRYSQLQGTKAEDVKAELVNTALNNDGLRPKTNSYMIDFTNSEFSRIRAEYSNSKKTIGNKDDSRFTLQYIMVLGAHPAHKF